jgi:hypothetical protein
MAGDLTISTINGGAIGAKNALINGNFGINQRAVSGTVTLSAGAYGHDRFKAGASGCTYTFATSNNITTLTITAGSLIQVIEGINLQSGTYTLSWTGTAQGKIGGGSYAGSGVTGTVTGGTNLNIEFDTGTLSLVQLEAGSVATPFERRQYGQELALCQRYFQKFGGTSYVGLSAGVLGNTTNFKSFLVFPVEMRTAASVTQANLIVADRTSFEATVTGISGTFANTKSAYLSVQNNAAGGAGQAAILAVANGTTGYLQFDSEL